MCRRNTIFPNHYTPRGARTQFSLELGREARSPPQPASSRGLGNVQFVWLFLSTGTRKLIIGGDEGGARARNRHGVPRVDAFPVGRLKVPRPTHRRGEPRVRLQSGSGQPALRRTGTAPGPVVWNGRCSNVTLCHSTPCLTMPGCITLSHSMPGRVTLCHITSCHISSPCQDTSRCVTPRYAMEGQHHGPYSRPSACSQWGRGGSLLESSAGSPVGKTLRGKSLLKKPHSCLGSG